MESSNIKPEAPFSAFITNLGKYNEGELIGKWVSFPTTQDIISDTMKEIGIDGQRYEEFFIPDYDCNVDGLHDILGEYENLDELNYLAAQLESTPKYDMDKLEAIFQNCDINSITDAINIAEGGNIDAYEYIPHINNDEDLGYYWVEESGTYDLSAMGNLANYIDYERFGRDIRLQEGGVFAQNGGYISDIRGGVDELYTGIADIPDEYMVTSSGSHEQIQDSGARDGEISVLLVKPGETPQQTEIGGDLQSMQQAVGGRIEAVYPFDDAVALFCNEQGKMEGMPLNRALYSPDNELYDIVAGDFLICGLGPDNFASLSPELMQKYGELFKYPEEFINLAGQIVAIKQPIDKPLEKAMGKETEIGGKPADIGKPDKPRITEPER